VDSFKWRGMFYHSIYVRYAILKFEIRVKIEHKNANQTYINLFHFSDQRTEREEERRLSSLVIKCKIES
jgi:hypothetical protein